MGIVVKATLDNMIKTGGKKNNPSTVACLTEPRIIEALFQNCGAFLIPEQNADSHRCRRLRGRGVPFAMLTRETMALVEDGDAVVVDEDAIRIWSRASEPDWPIPKKRKPRRKKKAGLKPARPRAIRGVKRLMRETIQPHLELMASHIAAPLRLEIHIQSESCTPSVWGADFHPGTIRLEEGKLNGLHVMLKIDFKQCAALVEQELSWEKDMRRVSGDLAYFSRLFDAWTAAVRERKGRQ